MGTSSAAAQQPVAPAYGERIEADEVVLRWALADGWHTQCLEWSWRPETSYEGGPFLVRDGGTCDLGAPDVAYLLDDLAVGPYYWHVKVAREVCSAEFDCTYEERWGPTAYFDSVEPPPPPPPTGCTRRAARYFAENALLPRAVRKYPRFFRGITGWTRRLRCHDLTGDGDPEMIIRLLCCTGGSPTPWAIFKHDPAGQWRMAYARLRDTVFQLRIRRRKVRTMLPAPYEGACTRYVRFRVVRWTGTRFRGRLTRRVRVPSPC
jgi:hypothetical protein